MTVPLLLIIGLCLVLLVMLLFQAGVIRELQRRVGFLERWGQERDPESFGLPGSDLEPELPMPDCEDAGKFHVAVPGGSNVCQNCPAVLVP